MKFSWNEKVQVAFNEYFENTAESFFEIGIMALKNSWKKCIELGTDYVEK